MRIDHEIATTELAGLWDRLAPHVASHGPPFPPYVLVGLLDLAALMVEHPLVGPAARAACARPTWDHQALLAEALAQLRPLAQRATELGARWDKLVRRLDKQHGHHADIEKTLRSMRKRKPWLGEDREIGDILRHGLDEGDAIDLAHSQHLAGSVLVVAQQGIDELRQLAPEEAARLNADLHLVKTGVEAIQTSYCEIEQFAREAELAPTLAWLERFHGRATALRGGALGPLPLAPDDPLSKGPASQALRNVSRLVAATRLGLSMGSARRHAVRRLTTFLERFEGASLRHAVRLARTTKPESVVQHVVDRFIFSEGLFPITHAVSGAGRIDTLFDAQEALVAEAERTSQRAILLELKQCVRPVPKSQKAMLAVVKRALGQADHYQRHIAAAPRWRDHEVHVLVIYAGDKRYRCDRDDVVLVYIGEASPSKGAELLEL